MDDNVLIVQAGDLLLLPDVQPGPMERINKALPCKVEWVVGLKEPWIIRKVK